MQKLFLFLFLFPLSIFCQVNDNFADGNFTHYVCWQGDTGKFEINSSFQLHLNSTGADTAVLVTSNSLLHNTEWGFWVKLALATSANNNARMYLVSDQPDLAAYLNGYFVQIGEANDSIALFKQSGNIFKKIIAGTIAYTNNSSNILRIKVTRDNIGNWKLYSDPSGGFNFALEGIGFDDSFTTTQFFGIFCKYTSSYATKFYFDDFYILPIIADTIAPFIKSVQIISPSQLDIMFSEEITDTSAENILNYVVNQNMGHPLTAIKDKVNRALVHLSFSPDFQQKIYYTVDVSNIRDISNNMMIPEQHPFLLNEANTFDIIINEIMADPEPLVALPNAEYIEIYNRSAYPVHLKNWILTVGNSKKIFPAIVLKPDSFLIVCNETAIPSFSKYGDCIGFTSFSLANEGQTLILSDSSNRIIHAVSYSNSWHNDEYKKNGGWSLELIDPANPCAEKNNWLSSSSMNGGTPGKINSVKNSNPDGKAPLLTHINLLSDKQIQVYFDEAMDSLFLKKPTSFFVDNNLGYPISLSPVKPNYSSVILEFATLFQSGIIYTLTCKDTLTDCVGNKLEINSTNHFAIPEIPAQNDIIINEILFDPMNEGVDYIEIYNRSEKVIGLNSFVLCSYDTISQKLEDISDIGSKGQLIFPKEYILLSTEPDIVKSQYTTSNPNGFIKLATFPNFNKEAGIAVLALKNLSLKLDMLTYSAEMHNPLLASTKGVSLERIHFNNASNDKTNWHSAAETVGFGTPGYINSQYVSEQLSNTMIQLSPDIFSPDNDGYQDVLTINYSFEEAGYFCSIAIYDANGRLIRQLIPKTLCGVSGSFSWDGVTDEHETAPEGIYIIYLEIMDIKGNVKHIKKTTVLALKK